MTEQHTPATQDTADAGTPAGGAAVVGPLTIRDLAVLGAVAIIFIASLLPLVVTTGGSINLWNTSNLFFVGIGMVLPLATGVLFVVRRFSPATTLRLGSLSLDQFASVVAVFAFFFFFAGTVTNFRLAYLVGLIGAVLFIAATTAAPWIPVLAADFGGRAETPSHVVARDAATPVKRASSHKPSATQPGAPDAVPGQLQAAAGGAGAAGSEGQGVGAAAWAASQPASAGHTSAGQIFTPAKDGRPADGAVTDDAAATRNAGTTGAGAGAGAATRASDGASTAGAGAGAGAATRASDGASTADSAARTDSKAKAEAADKGPATNVRADGASGTATTINPQQPAAVQHATAPAAAEAAVPAKESIAATIDPKAAAPAVIAEPFWFAVDRPQNVIDQNTRQFIYKLTPGSWILALEDRGNSFLVQDSHGKTGVLLDLVGIERASDSQ